MSYLVVNLPLSWNSRALKSTLGCFLQTYWSLSYFHAFISFPKCCNVSNLENILSGAILRKDHNFAYLIQLFLILIEAVVLSWHLQRMPTDCFGWRCCLESQSYEGLKLDGPASKTDFAAAVCTDSFNLYLWN